MNEWLLGGLVVVLALLWIGHYYLVLELRGLRHDLFYPSKERPRKFRWLPRKEN